MSDKFLVNLGTPSDGSVSTPKLVDGAVTTPKIADDAVTLPKMAAGTAGNLITYDASGDPAAVATGTAAQVLTSQGAGAAPTFQDAASGGKILQVVQDEITAAVTITGVTTFTDVTGLAVTITPSSASSTILISGVLRISYQSGTGPSARFVRDSTVIHLGDASGSEQRGIWCGSQQSVDEQERITSIPIYYVDSPATTSAVTYKFQIRNDNSGHTTYVNRTYSGSPATQLVRTASNIVAMEISA